MKEGIRLIGATPLGAPPLAEFLSSAEARQILQYCGFEMSILNDIQSDLSRLIV
ncbi:hypothetical protein ACLECU_11650 [Lonsdalea quercina]|uniref:hypothetical protein n=1 Tax=Lonsdalea quercina TaxID=71657 RepID=UPI0039762BF2